MTIYNLVNYKGEYDESVECDTLEEAQEIANRGNIGEYYTDLEAVLADEEYK